MGRPKASKTKGFEEIKRRFFEVSRTSNASQLAKYLERRTSSVTRPFKEQRIPDSWFALIADKANTTEGYLRTGIETLNNEVCMEDDKMLEKENRGLQEKLYDAQNKIIALLEAQHDCDQQKFSKKEILDVLGKRNTGNGNEPSEIL